MEVKDMTMGELSGFVWCTLSISELFLQVCEESAELAKAASTMGQYAAKLDRARNKKNPTPMTEGQCRAQIEEAMRSVKEEYMDLMTSYKLAMGLCENNEDQRPKMERWVKRLVEVQEGKHGKQD